MGFKTAASEEDVLSPISASIKIFQGQEARTVNSASHAVPRFYCWCSLLPSHTSLLSLGTPRLPLAASHMLSGYPGHVCILLQRPIYPALHTKARNSSWVLPCSSCSTHCLHLLLSETLNVTPAHSGTQRQRAKESPASPALAWEGAAILQPSLLLSHATDTRQGGSCRAVLSILHSMVLWGEREKHLLGTIISLIPKATSRKFLNISEHFGHCHKPVPA